jgi:hypothetical protein
LKIWLKVLTACLTSWLLLSALGMVVSGFKILGAPQSTLGVIIPLLLAFLACYGLSWINSRSLGYSFVGALGGILVGLPVSYLLLVPFGYWLAARFWPLSNLTLSGSLGGAWFLIGIVGIVEILTDRLNNNKRWLMMLTGIGIVTIIIYCAELITARFGLSNNLSVVKLDIYGPLTWGSIVGITNSRNLKQKNMEEK